LPAYLVALGWQKHHAALIALAEIAEGYSKVVRAKESKEGEIVLMELG
ncbi:hypothetical protein Tco_1139248, partial [Tanacetum coccineum]